jgi:hypothetical protein
MHKGYKCLDRSTGRIFISRDVVFDEKVFPFSTPGVSIDVSTLEQAITFPSDEPVTSAPMRNYDLSFLTANPPGLGDIFQVPAAVVTDPVQMDGSVSKSHMFDVHDSVPSSHMLDMHGRALQGSSREAVSPGMISGPVPSSHKVDVHGRALHASSPEAVLPGEASRPVPALIPKQKTIDG